MNPIIIEPQIKVKPEIECDVNQKQEYKFLGTIKLIPGLKLWSFNYKTAELKIVEVKKTKDITFDKKKVKNDHALYNPECLYFQALNKNNAVKKIEKIINSMK